MVWKLCDKEECPKFELLVRLLFVLCENGLIENNKNFGWVSIRTSTELCVGFCRMNRDGSVFWQSSPEHREGSFRQLWWTSVIKMCL